jgi:hypothetical protein
MPSYMGPARLVVDGSVHDVAVNLHSFLDLGSSEAAWRVVVVDADFVPRPHPGTLAEVRLPDGRAGTGVLTDRRIEGTGPGPLALG